MDIPRHGRQGADAGNFVAAEEVGRLRERSAHSSIERSAPSGTRNTETRSTKRPSHSVVCGGRGVERKAARSTATKPSARCSARPARLHSSGWRAVQSRTWTRRASPSPSSPGSPRTLARRRRPPLLLDVWSTQQQRRRKECAEREDTARARLGERSHLVPRSARRREARDPCEWRLQVAFGVDVAARRLRELVER